MKKEIYYTVFEEPLRLPLEIIKEWSLNDVFVYFRKKIGKMAQPPRPGMGGGFNPLQNQGQGWSAPAPMSMGNGPPPGVRGQGPPG